MPGHGTSVIKILIGESGLYESKGRCHHLEKVSTMISIRVSSNYLSDNLNVHYRLHYVKVDKFVEAGINYTL